MSLEAGARFGPYEILSPLGAGGMGEVWRARDARLGRDVALKLVPEAFAADGERMERFEREAKLLASLNHPHIAALYGLEEAGGRRALVMELVPGGTLAERLAGGPIPLEEALSLARQVAEALEHAHEHGIIHRDLKPANVKVTPAGDVKVLDFGLGRPVAGDATSGADLLSSPTLTRDGTRAGVILGTVPYMSPEQARGQALDGRTDVWSFGVVLFEMLTGERLFRGDTTSDVLAAVLKTEVDWSQLPAVTPAACRRLLRRCLERDLRLRLHSMADARLEIVEAAQGTDSDGSRGPRVRWRTALPWAVALLAVLAVAALLRGRPSAPRAPRVSRLTLPLMPHPVALGGIALSPDGAELAYVSAGQIQVRALDREGVRALPDALGSQPFFSPDGAWIGFVGTDEQLRKVPVSGGPVVRLTDGPRRLGHCAWAPDEVILCTQPWSDRPGELLRIPAGGGVADPLPTAAGGLRERVQWPSVLPGGRAALLTVIRSPGGSVVDAAIAVQRLDTGERRVLVADGAQAVRAATGHIVFARGASLLAVLFDLATLTLRGAPAPVVEHVSRDYVGGGRYALAGDGTLVYYKEVADTRPLLWVDRRGSATRIAVPDHVFFDPRISPDGSRIAVQASDAGSDTWICELARGALTRLTFDPAEDETPVWSPDGAWVAWASQPSRGPRQLHRRRADGSGDDQVVWSTSAHAHLHDWSPDGKYLLVTLDSVNTGRDVWLVPVDGGEARPLLDGPFEEWNPRMSPDGRWLAYASNEAGRFDVYVRRFPELSGNVQVSSGGGDRPAWTARGRELVYRSADGHVTSVGLSPGPDGNMRVRRPEALFPDAYGAATGRTSHPDYDVHPDGRRFVMVGSQSREATVAMSVVLNWFEELEKLAPRKP